MHYTPFILFLVLFEEREKNKGQLTTPRQRDLILHTA